jgi:hypothetical protein
MFGYYQDQHGERDPVIRLWTELTGRTLSPKERHLFLRRTDAEVLRGLLMQHGPDWMTAAARRCLHRDKDTRVELKLRDWVRACDQLEESQRWQPGMTETPGDGDP